MELADTIEEVKTTCTMCAHKATITAKFFVNALGKHEFIVNGSDQPDLGAEDKYTALCFSCWHQATGGGRDANYCGTPDTCNDS